MLPTLKLLAEAVVGELNQGEWSLDFVARHAYRLPLACEQVNSLTVTVTPHRLTIESQPHGLDKSTYQIDLLIQHRLESESAEEIEPLLGLAEELARYFRLRRPTAMPATVCVKVVNEPVYTLEQLEGALCFTSVLALTFQTIQ